MSAILKMCVPFLAYFTLLDQKRKQTLGGIGIESNLRKLLLSLLTLLFVWHILRCCIKNVNNHWVESESKFEIYLMVAESVLHGEKTSYGPDFRGHFSTRHALFLFSPINSLTVSPWKIKDRKNKRVDTFVTHARVSGNLGPRCVYILTA